MGTNSHSHHHWFPPTHPPPNQHCNIDSHYTQFITKKKKKPTPPFSARSDKNDKWPSPFSICRLSVLHGGCLRHYRLFPHCKFSRTTPFSFEMGREEGSVIGSHKHVTGLIFILHVIWICKESDYQKRQVKGIINAFRWHTPQRLHLLQPLTEILQCH